MYVSVQCTVQCIVYIQCIQCTSKVQHSVQSHVPYNIQSIVYHRVYSNTLNVHQVYGVKFSVTVYIPMYSVQSGTHLSVHPSV